MLVMLKYAMPSFTPPVENSGPPKEGMGHLDFWRFYKTMIQYGRTVIIDGGVATPLASEGARTFSIDELNAADPGSGYGGRAAFTGARTWEVTSGERTILIAAGYSVP